MKQNDLSWSIPVMRMGYAGRGLVYLVVAGFSLYAIWYGGRAKGTSSAMAQLETTGWGTLVLLLILIGILSFAVWRGVDALFDLENCGTDTRGLLKRAAFLVSAVIHLGLGVLAFSLLFTADDGGGGSSLARWLGTIMGWPGGRLLVGAAGLSIVFFGFRYGDRGVRETYRDHLQANHFTTHWNWLLKTGLIARGLIVAIVGMLFLYAAWRADPNAAGGTGDAFSWLTSQPYGQVLVAVICIGLLAFAAVCFVNAAYRVIPKVSGEDTRTLGAWLEDKARQAA